MKFNYDKVKGSLGEVQNTLHWWVEFLAESETDASIVNAFKGDVPIRVTTSALPTPTVTHNEVQLQGRTIRYVGKVEKHGEVALTFVEGTDTKVLDAAMTWLSKYWSSLEGKQIGTNKLKLKVVLHLLDPGDNETMSFTLRGCLPSIEHGGELGQDPTSMQPVLTVAYDDYEYKGQAGEVW